MTQTQKPDRAYCPACGQKYAIPVAELQRRPGLRFRASCRSCQTGFSVRWEDGALATEIEEILPETENERITLAKGTRVGKYEIEEPLASGGSSAVYRAWDPGANRMVALKVLHQPPDAEYGSRFRNEVEVQGNLKHPHLMPIFDHGAVDGKPYYTMELLHKPMTFDTIVSLFRSQRLAYNPTLRRLSSLPDMVRRVILPVARAIAFANRNGVIHRDLKPANVIIDAKTAHVYVIDFGICHLYKTTGSRLMLRGQESSGAEDERRMAMGTVRCMPPEQARGDVSPQGDVWAIGALLHYTVTGDYPVAPAIDLNKVGLDARIRNLERIAQSSRDAGDEHEAAFYESRLAELRDGEHRTMKDLLRDARQGIYQPLPAGLGSPLASIIERAMRADPARRYQTAEELADDLQAWLDGKSVRAYGEELGRAKATLYKTRLFVRRNQPALVAVCGVLALLTIALAIFLFRRAGQEDRRIDQLLFEARETTDPGVREDRARAILSLRPNHAEAAELLDRARRYAPIRAKVIEARAVLAEMRSRWADKAPNARLLERDRRRAEDAAAVLERGVLPDLRSLPKDRQASKLEAEAEELASQLRGRKVVRLRELPDGAEVLLVGTISPADRAFDWEEERSLGTAPLPVPEIVLEPGSYVLLVRRGAGRALHLPFFVTHRTRSGSEIVCPIDPADVPAGMVYVPSTARMIYGDARFQDEPSIVEVAPFFIDRHEVTNEEYARYLASLEPSQRVRAVPRRPLPSGSMKELWNKTADGYAYPGGTGREPVTNISLLDAQAYARWAGKRLPSPQEWELTARGVDGRDYPFGMTLDPAACNTATGTLATVGSFPRDRSPFGAFDTAGNVAEWTSDSGAERTIVKGGSFELPRIHAMPTSFIRREAVRPWADVGFRCAKSAQ